MHRTRWSHFWLSVSAILVGFAAFAPPAAAQTRALYVSTTGSDEQGNGQSPSTAFRTIGRALREVPTVVDANWTIAVEGGTYAESVELKRFVMPAFLSNQQLRSEPVVRSIAIASTGGGVTIAPATGSPCISAASVLLFLESLTCRVSGENTNGIASAGATLVLDNMRVEAASNALHGIYAEVSLVYLGGAFTVEGPFAQGLVARVNTLARTGTRNHPDAANLTFRGIRSQAIFVRDGGNFTSAFERGTVRVINSGQGIYALLGSRVFLNATLPLELENVTVGVAATQLSGVNVSQVVVNGSLPTTFARCHLASYVVLENVSAPSPRSADTDGTCMIFTY